MVKPGEVCVMFHFDGIDFEPIPFVDEFIKIEPEPCTVHKGPYTIGPIECKVLPKPKTCEACCRLPARCTCTPRMGCEWAELPREPRNLFGVSWAMSDEDYILPRPTEIRLFGDDVTFCAWCHWELDACTCHPNARGVE